MTILDTNNHAPLFDQSVYYFSVYENDEPDTTLTDMTLDEVIGVIHARDLDIGDNGAVSYDVTSRNARGLFVVPTVSYGISYEVVSK